MRNLACMKHFDVLEGCEKTENPISTPTPILAINDIRLGVCGVLFQCPSLWHCCIHPYG